MFCYQRSFGLPTEIATLKQFRALISAPRTFQQVKEAREALARGDRKTYDAKKKGLPLAIFIGTFEESVKVIENKITGEKKEMKGCWRLQKHCRLNGLCVIDFDHVAGDVRKVWDEAYAKLSEEDKKRVLFVFVTPSGHGLKVVFIADAAVGNLIDNQIVFSKKLGLNPDEACKDASRGAFLTTSEDIIFMDEERLINYESEGFGKKYNEEYHAGHSQPTIDVAKDSADSSNLAPVEGAGKDIPVVYEGDGGNNRPPEFLTYHGVPYQQIVAAWVGDKKIEQGDRHRTSLVLADHLRYITDNDSKLIEQILRETPFVKEIIEERNEDVSTTVKSAQGYEFLKGLDEAGVVGCMKHYPGHGEASKDTHRGRASIDKTWEELLAYELVPFISGIQAGGRMIMTGHLIFPKITGNAISTTLSPVMLTEKLRGELGFDGVIVTDGLEMASIRGKYPPAKSAVKAVQAGADMLLAPFAYEVAFDAVVAAVEDGTISEARLDESVRRILALKKYIYDQRR